MKKIQLTIKTLPDGIWIAETKKNFKRFSECTKLLISNGFVRHSECGNLIRYDGAMCTAFIVIGNQTHPYSHPDWHSLSISIYSKQQLLTN